MCDCQGFEPLVASLFREEADVFHVAVALGEVHAVADDELVRNLEANVVGFDRDEAALGFVEAGGDLERGGFVLEHQAAQVAQGETGVEDVFDDDDVLALDGVVDVLDELDGARGDAGAAIAGDGDEVEGGVDGNGAGEVGEEDRRAFEYADQDDDLPGVIGGDLLAERLDAVGDLRISRRGCPLLRRAGKAGVLVAIEDSVARIGGGGKGRYTLTKRGLCFPISILARCIWARLG